MRELRVAYVTAGGAGMFCGSCMHDNTLAAALRRLGVPITLVPTFTPIRTDEEDVSLHRVYLGGLNVYLEERWPAFRRLPRVLRRGLSHPLLLGLLAKLALQQRGNGDGGMALSLLRGEEGHHAAEIRDLVDFVADDLKPELVNVTNLLIAGFVPALKRRRQVPVVVTLQGDDLFLDSLPPSDREAVLGEMRRVAAQVDAFVTCNAFYRDLMAGLLQIPVGRFHLVPLGIADPESFSAEPPGRRDGPPTVGYLARICPDKGFGVLVEAYLILRTLPGMEGVRLHAGGWLGASDKAFFGAQCRRLQQAGAAGSFAYIDIPDRPAKIRFLGGLDVFSVPAVHGEPKGIYVLEALAAGVPVVQPDHGAFPELLAGTGGGRLVPSGDPRALARQLHTLLIDEGERLRLGRAGQASVREHHHDEAMARRTLDVWMRLVSRGDSFLTEC